MNDIVYSVRRPIRVSENEADYSVERIDREAPVLRDELFTALEKVYIPPIPYKNAKLITEGKDAGKYKVVVERGTVIGRIGNTMNMGVVLTRGRGYNSSKYATKYPDVLKKVIAYGNAVVPIGFTYNAITINRNVQAKRHYDGANKGKSIIVGFGPYDGGALRVYGKQSEEYVAHDIHDRPLLFNGALLEHETEPFSGTRYTIIFYTQKPGLTISGYETIGQ